MKTGDITLLYTEGLKLSINQGIIMDCKEQSIAIVKREDKRGIYYSINDKIGGIPNSPNNDECLMALLLINQGRFMHSSYNSKFVTFK